MRIISKKKIRDYIVDHAQAELPLVEWYFRMLNTKSATLTELKRVFNAVDYVGGYTIFNIGGNNYRLITAVHYNTQHCYIREIWTHAQYSKTSNQEKIRRGKL